MVGILMTTHKERLALDLIYAALGSIEGLDPKDVAIRKLGILLGIASDLCHELDIPEELAITLLKHRFAEYRLTILKEQTK
jgi:hypothetical protein